MKDKIKGAIELLEENGYFIDLWADDDFLNAGGELNIELTDEDLSNLKQLMKKKIGC